ncbi:MAG: hypothetical protein IPN22_04810 [Bacteroidetes bacterium]|nr:hypothetical protein [Bacteroidota bacterium]
MMHPRGKLILFLLLCLLGTNVAEAQQRRFNSELEKFCKEAVRDFKSIDPERKQVLDDMAEQLSRKKLVLFTCKTNTRRTLMLQVWAQSAFYYYGLYNKTAFSMGDTVSQVYPAVAAVLTESGFYCLQLENKEAKSYSISINKDFPINILTSKNELGNVDTAKTVVVNICYEEEVSNLSMLQGHVDLPYPSPHRYDHSPEEMQQYRTLNRQIATEMLYLADRTEKVLIRELKGNR